MRGKYIVGLKEEAWKWLSVDGKSIFAAIVLSVIADAAPGDWPMLSSKASILHVQRI